MQIMTATLPTLYVHVVLNSVMFPQILYDTVLYARHFLPVKFFPEYFFYENGDLSFLLYFSKQCSVENIQGKFQKNSSGTFISEESP